MLAVLLHGTGGSDKDYFWFGDTRNHLINNGYKVWWPLLPNTHKPRIEETLGFVLDNLPPTDDKTIIIGHSSACPLILALLERLEKPIDKAILVSGFYKELNDTAKLMLLETYDWAKIKSMANRIVILNSDDDPWGCDDKQAMFVADQLDAEFILMKGQAHMGSKAFNQPYKKFPLINKLIDS